ncbi:hypothetical protein NPIL_383271 [Nephila pilipes]|uniref:Uncharacterized protein n=1 Tax=Nephila pilipes TaxID=299642 RepID=A0A8X6QWJ0_NEPPI|nr:hypothetical protein NPIL_383271 [Nephila pilipes]
MGLQRVMTMPHNTLRAANFNESYSQSQPIGKLTPVIRYFQNANMIHEQMVQTPDMKGIILATTENSASHEYDFEDEIKIR